MQHIQQVETSPKPGLPPPVKDEPHGMQVNTRSQRDEGYRGTVMASRAITMAKQVANRKRGGRIRAIATLENPPPSCRLGSYLKCKSSWTTLLHTARFDTCIYQSKLPPGHRNLKPQQFSGSMLGIKELQGRCKCNQMR